MDRPDEETTVKVWIQWGTALPRLGDRIPISEWDRAKYKREGEEWQRTVGVPFSPRSLGEAYMRQEPVPRGEWPNPALDVLDAAWALVRVRERIDEKSTMVDRAAFDRLEKLLHEIKRAAEAEPNERH